MDIFAHGLYGGAAFVNTSKKSFWKAVGWGMFPDLFAFGLFLPFFLIVYGLHSPQQVLRTEPPTHPLVPQFVHVLYSLSHSLIIFTLVFFVVWFVKKKPVYEMLAWGLHIVMDIPTHTSAFFPTPFLYPFSSFYLNGISWATSRVFFSYWGLLVLIYIFQWRRRKTIKNNHY